MHRTIKTIIKRRSALAVTGGALAAPALSVAGERDPVIALVAKWQVAMGAEAKANEAADSFMKANAGVSSLALEAAYEARHDERLAIGREICATPATTPAGLCAQLRFFLADFGTDIEDGYGTGYEKIVATLTAGVDAVEGGA